MLHVPSHEAPGLFDERSDPDFRAVFGRLLRDATHVDVALNRIRLSTLDLEADEMEGLRRLRVLLAQVNATTLSAEAHGMLLGPRRGRTLRHLTDLLDQGVVQVRAAPLGGWSPDYTVFRGPEGARAVLLGLHWLERPFPHRGPALAGLHGPRGARLAGRRFDESWAQAHDIRPAIQGILQRARRLADRVAAEGLRGPHPRGAGSAADELDTPSSPD